MLPIRPGDVARRSSSQDAAADDADLAEFVPRAQDFWNTWFQELTDHGTDVMARGCGWN